MSPPPGSVRSWWVWGQDGFHRLPPSVLCPPQLSSFPLVLFAPPATEEWYVQDQSSGKVTPGSSRPGEM